LYILPLISPSRTRFPHSIFHGQTVHSSEKCLPWLLSLSFVLILTFICTFHSLSSIFLTPPSTGEYSSPPAPRLERHYRVLITFVGIENAIHSPCPSSYNLWQIGKSSPRSRMKISESAIPIRDHHQPVLPTDWQTSAPSACS
jgi:hypothetical protein